MYHRRKYDAFVSSTTIRPNSLNEIEVETLCLNCRFVLVKIKVFKNNIPKNRITIIPRTKLETSIGHKMHHLNK